MPETQRILKRGRGRPKAFDRSTALDVAMKMFWDRGFEGTCLDDLIETMGISSSSFYNSFGSKETLYHEATEIYLSSAAKWFTGELNAPGRDTKTAIEAVLNATAKQFTAQDHPCGCMISTAGTHLPPSLGSVRDMMASHRKLGQSAFAARIRKGIQDGDLPKHVKADALAAFYSAVSQGMAVQARDGVTRKRLVDIVQIAMMAWPVN
jgi:AcrR family transcriptional regulator